MAKFAFIFPREDMVEPARRTAEKLGMDVVMNTSIITARSAEAALQARDLGADIIVARGRQADIIKEAVDIPVHEVRLTGQEVALLLYKARQLVPQKAKPRIGMVTTPNMISDIRYFDEVLSVEHHTYFVKDESELESMANQAMEDGMDVILGGDFVNQCCRRRGWLTLFLGATEDSVINALHNARNVGVALDAERKNTAHLQTLLAYSFNGIIELDNGGMITLVNDMACKILGKAQDTLVGEFLSSLMPEEDRELLEEVLSGRGELYFSSLKVNEVNIVANVASVVQGTAHEGVVFSFYEMREVQSHGARARQAKYRLHRHLAHGRFEDVDNLGREMQRVAKRARIFAETAQPILLQGEVGSGKALFAQSIHNGSPCAQGPFVTFSCVDGWKDQCQALTKAAKYAQSGTLYVDSIDQLHQDSQYVLRRLVESEIVQDQDDEYPVPVEVRVIASLNGSLYELAREGRFRQDLYYILAPMLLELPPLRTRPEDLEHTVDMCLDDCVTRLSRYVVLTRDARGALLNYSWKGNYIQIKAFIERMVLTAPSRTIHEGYVRQLLESLYPESVQEQDIHPQAPSIDPEQERLMDALNRHGGNRTVVAQELGISKTTLWRRMKHYGIYDKQFS